MTTQPLLTPSQVARLLNVSTTTVYRLVKTRQLHALRMGRQIRVSVEAVEQFLGHNEEEE